MTWHLLSPVAQDLGESPFWQPLEQMLYWANTLQHAVYVWDYEPHGNTLVAHRIFLKFASKSEN